ncbi:amino acid adenylation domain-containing protein [Marinobacter sp. 1Y8]
MSFKPERFENFADVLSFHARHCPEGDVIRHIVSDDAPPLVTRYGELDRHARAVAAMLQDQLAPAAGERCLLMLPSGADFAAAFFGCFHAGVIAVPAFPPENNRQAYFDRLAGIMRDAKPKAVLGLAADLERYEAQLTPLLPEGGKLLAVDSVDRALADALQPHAIAPQDLAFLQYTSGSTSAPKGVMVSHANLMANERAMAQGFNATEDEVWVNWLPLFHDMGLMAGLLLPIYHGHCVHLMTPQFFLQRPARWLEAISKNKGTFSGGPDFAYRLCAERIPASEIEKLDLSHWRLAFTGSEPIRPETLTLFAGNMAIGGFDERSLAPSYGLAEATLFVCSHGLDRDTRYRINTFDARQLATEDGENAVRTSTLVGCGLSDQDHPLKLLDPVTGESVGNGQVGEIWVGGPSVTQGYWQNPEATAAAFAEEDDVRWTRTGDLGLVHEGDLYIAGRQKDVIILNGQNLYPQDIEHLLEQEIELLRQGRISAFPVADEVGAEAIGLALEISRNVRRLVRPEMICSTIAETLSEALQVAPHLILLLEPGTLPRTTSGKLQRSACLPGWKQQSLSVFAAWRGGRLLDDGVEAGSSGAAESSLHPEVVAAWRDALNCDQLDAQSHFFSLGGNSVAAMQVLSRVSTALGIQLEPAGLFEHTRLGTFSDWVMAQAKAASPQDVVPPAPLDAPLLQSHAQQRLWFLDRLEAGSTAYHLCGEWVLTGEPDRAALRASFDALAARHDSLRTVFTADADNRPLQVIQSAAPVTIHQHSIQDQAALDVLSRELVGQPMDLEKGPLWQAHLVKMGTGDFRILLVIHHIIADGWSAQVLVEDFAELYRAHVEQRPAQLADLAVSYADVAQWQRQQLANENESLLAWWKAELGDEQPVLELPADRTRPDQQSHRGARFAFNFPPELSERLRALAQDRGVTLFMLMLALYKTQLYRYSGQRDLRVAVPVAGRTRQETERLIGLFVNTLVLRSEPGAGQAFNDFLAQVKTHTLGAQAHQMLPFDQLVEALQPERNLRHNPLCQVKFTQQLPLPENVELPGLRLSMHQRDDDTAHFDLGLDITDQPKGIKAVLTYASDLFDEARIEAFADELTSLAAQVVERPEIRLGELALQAVPSMQTGALAGLPRADVLALWRDQLPTCQNRIALQYDDEALDFAWLESESNRLSHALRAKGVDWESRVGLCLDRSPAFVVAMLATLKAGAAFVPLDPKWPAERQAFVLGDCDATALLADNAIAGFDGPVMDFSASADWRQYADQPLNAAIHPSQAAYLIYTSGTSGTPKGVVVSHGALANYVQGLLQTLKLTPDASMAMVSTVAADLGHTTLFGALCSGRTLHLLSADRVMDAEGFATYMDAHQVGVLKIVPTHLAGLLQADNPARALPTEALIMGGEAIAPELVHQVQQLRPQCRVFNHYGPSESTVGVLLNELQSNAPTGAVPLGYPLPNIRALVLSDEGLALPQGAVGELYLGGAGLARGYLQRSGQTASQFLPDPFHSGERLYATGDRALMLTDGRMTFHGRTDDQIKVRGYRVSLGEIGHRLRRYPGVSDAHVQVGDDGQLIVYPLVKGVESFDVEALRGVLTEQLPDYMVPAHIVPLAAFPLTVNGKLDRQALPAPDRQSADFDAPQGPVEEVLAGLWQQLLKIEQIGRHDNFFTLGGDSIISLQVIARARKQGIRLMPKQLFEKQTIAELAQVADTDAPAAAPAPQDSQAKESAADFPLSPIQQAFFDRPFEGMDHWNQSVRLSAREPLDAERLQQALAAIVAQHSSLRLRFFRNDAGQWCQRFEAASRNSGDSVLWLRHAMNEADIVGYFNEAQRSLDLVQGPLIRAVLVNLDTGGQQLLLAVHHLAVDGVSWRILLEDLQLAYRQLASGQSVSLDKVSADFADWSRYLQSVAASGSFDSELPFWESMLVSDTTLPCDKPEGSALISDTESLGMALDAELTTRLLNDVPAAYRTQINDILLAALADALARWTGSSRNVITLEGHGRDLPDQTLDLSRTLGWFTRLYPVALEAGADLTTTLKATKEHLRELPSGGLGFGVLKHLNQATLDTCQGIGLTFNYLGRFDGADKRASLVLTDGDTGATRASNGFMANALVVDGLIRDGQLRFDWQFSRARFRAESIEQLMVLYRDALTDLIEGCAESAGGLTPSDVPLASVDQVWLDQLPDARNIEDVLPLAAMQEGILLHSLLEQGTGIYLMQDHYQVDADVDFDAFTKAWNAVVQRHPMLRTGFCGLDGGEQRQIVYRKVPSPTQYIDLSHLDRDSAEQELEALLAQERREGFDFAKPPLLRLRLVHFGPQDNRIIQSHHHALIDAWCRGLMLAEFFAHYQASLGGRLRSLPPARPYRDFIAWLQSQDDELSRRYWQSTLAGFSEVTPLPYQHSPVGESGISDVTLMLDLHQTEQLAARARSLKLTVNTFMQAAWALLLMRHSGRSDVVFGVTVAGRPAELDGIEETLGLFINTLPLRVQGAGARMTTGELLNAMQAVNADMRQHEHLSLAEVQHLAETARGDALFDSLFVFENVPMGAEVMAAASEYRITPLANRTHTNYPLTVVILPGETYQLQFSYDQQRFRSDDMAALLEQFRDVLLQLVASTDQPIADIELNSSEDVRHLMALGQGPERPDWTSLSYLERFEAWTLADPQREVARCMGQSLSYVELNGQSNQLGHGLIAAGVKPDQVVALYAPRGLALLSMMIGTFKAGGAYLALDDRHPPARSARMMANSKAPVLLMPEACREEVAAILAETDYAPQVLTVESLLASGELSNPGIYAGMGQLAYVIFTSGSTGEPKGVMVNQQGMLNNQLSKVPYLELGEGDVVAQTAATGFDISVWQFFTAPLFGGRVEIIPDAITHDPQRLLAHVADNGVSVLESVPAVIDGMLASPDRPLPGLRWLLPTGEALQKVLVERWFARYPGIPLVNAYGPAECADDVALHTLRSADTASVPIGLPTDNNRLYVLDDTLALAPQGVIGELYVGGTGVGRGYAGRPGLTAERFVPDPFGNPGDRLYRTGDLTRWNEDGVLEYAGRADFQLKIRGQRIEPGEIESCLQQCAGVRHAVVAAQPTPHGVQLVGYMVAESGATIDIESVRGTLSAALPAVMVPSHLLILDQLPLNANGKLDRKALPSPDWQARSFEAPLGDLEQSLAEVWQDLLKVEKVGRHDHFFELGGHSLLATRLLSRIRDRFDVNVPLAEAFEATTVASMAQVIARLQANTLDEEKLDSLDALMSELEEIE